MNWYNDDTLWENFYDCMFDHESFKLAQIQSQELMTLIDKPIQTILDMGCGPGRHCLALSKMGYKVTGIDSSAFLLEKAKKKAHSLGLKCQFELQDMLNYQAKNPHDLIINMFNSFGYFDSQSKNQAFVNNCYNNLSSQGTLVIDTVGKETLARQIEPVHLTEYPNGDIRIERPLLTDNMQIFSNEWILIKGKSAFRRNYQHYVYTPIELREMCLKAGFNEIEVYGSLSGDAYELDSDRLVIVAQK
ncbi:MAG: class I SAM-dependent methyltransferase [Marinicellaceae bacterium]